MAAMSDETSGPPGPSDSTITEQTARTYRDNLVSELETENERLRTWADTLQLALDDRTSELRAFGVAAQLVQGARRVARQPRLLGRIPGAALRAVRGGGSAGSDTGRPRASTPPDLRRLAGPGSAGRIGGSRPARALTIGLVADEPLRLALGAECTLIVLTPGNWRAAVAATRPDLVLVESAWRAAAGAWQYRIAWYGHPTSIRLVDLRALTEWCSANDVPSIFWDTAGPVGRGRFDEAASLFDVILTSDPAGLAHYDALATRRATIVDVLEAGVQFRHHHPATEAEPPLDSLGAVAGPVFVGYYDRARSLADREALDRLLDAGLARGLAIFDTSGVAGPDAPGFPERFQPAIRPFAAADRRAAVLRNASVVLVDAPGGATELVPAGLLEALASGTPVISTPSRAVEARFGSDVPGAAPADDPAVELNRILADPATARARIRRGVLPALARDGSIGDRLARLAAAAGIVVDPARTRIAVLVLHDGAAATVATAQALNRLASVSEFVVGSTDWDGAGRALAESLRAARPGIPVRLIEQSRGATVAVRRARLAQATDVEWIAPWAHQTVDRSATGAPDPLVDPLDSLLVGIVFQPGDRVDGDDPRLPHAFRRGSNVAGG